MRRNYISATILIFPILALLFWVVSINYKISRAPEVMIAVTGYDPRDLLSGHYILLRPMWNKTDCTQFENNECQTDKFDYSYRFYMPEHEAKYLDRIIGRSRDLSMHLKFAMPYNASPVIKQLYIEGLKWEEWLKQKKEVLNNKDAQK